jgi:hypothetical protein
LQPLSLLLVRQELSLSFLLITIPQLKGVDMFLAFVQEAVDSGNVTVSLWTILLILAIIALVVFIFRNVRR